MSFPLSSLEFTPGNGSLKNSSGCFDFMHFFWSHAEDAILQALAQLAVHNFAHLFLLLFNGTRGIDNVEADFFGHGVVLIQNASLENPETFFHIATEPQVHARFVKFDSIPAAENTADGDIQGDAEIETEIRPDGELI